MSEKNNANNNSFDIESYLKGLSTETRLDIYMYLAFYGEMTTTQLAKALGKSHQTISHHLAIMEQAKIVEQTRVEVCKNYIEKYYSLHSDSLKGFNTLVNESPSFEYIKKEYPVLAQEMMLGILGFIRAIALKASRLIKNIEKTNSCTFDARIRLVSEKEAKRILSTNNFKESCRELINDRKSSDIPEVALIFAAFPLKKILEPVDAHIECDVDK